MRAYILSTYDEYGADDPVVCLDRSRVVDMYSKRFYPPDGFKWGEMSEGTRAWCMEAFYSDLAELIKFIYSSDGSIAKKDLGDGWGGVQLHIAELFE